MSDIDTEVEKKARNILRKYGYRGGRFVESETAHVAVKEALITAIPNNKEWQTCDFSDIAYGEEYELRHTYVKEQAHGHGADVIIERGPARYYRRVDENGKD